MAVAYALLVLFTAVNVLVWGCGLSKPNRVTVTLTILAWVVGLAGLVLSGSRI